MNFSSASELVSNRSEMALTRMTPSRVFQALQARACVSLLCWQLCCLRVVLQRANEKLHLSVFGPWLILSIFLHLRSSRHFPVLQAPLHLLCWLIQGKPHAYYMWLQYETDELSGGYICVNTSNQHLFPCWSSTHPSFCPEEIQLQSLYLRQLHTCTHLHAAICWTIYITGFPFMEAMQNTYFWRPKNIFIRRRARQVKTGLKWWSTPPWLLKLNKKSVLSMISSDFSISHRQGI